MSWNVVEQDESNKIREPRIVIRQDRSPVRGAFYGAVLGFGVTLLLATYASVPLGEHAPWVAAGFGAVGGLILSWFGPALRRRN
jgi:hypothetical protein